MISVFRKKKKRGVRGEENLSFGRPLRPSWVLEFFLWTIFFTIFGYTLFFSGFLDVTKKNITGLETLDTKVVAAEIDDALVGTSFHIFHKDNLLLIRPAALEARLLDRFPKARSVTVTRRFPDTIDVRFEERPRIFVWHSGDVHLLIDESGRAHALGHAEDPENVSSVVPIIDDSGQYAMPGTSVVDGSFLQFIGGLSDELDRRFGIGLGNEYHLPSRFAAEVRVMTTAGWELRINTERSVESSLDAFGLLWEKEKLGAKQEILSYVDLRTENRIYYAFHDGTPEAQAIIDRNTATDAAAAAKTPAPAPVVTTEKKKR